MGVSFKVARAGTRYRPKAGLSDDNPESDKGGDSVQGLHEDDALEWHPCLDYQSSQCPLTWSSFS
ncbi:hypothetical protein Dsin_028992 [Dipteronia sinensis]|uniref:Uncharacterized protein n=1 Tax=Dipteronia sinensis TaxID=43782 RepID=A0AAE0DV25_9ROSI|nr:hypothetical protein Dsin_028992 [Dipteronia sinensis]